MLAQLRQLLAFAVVLVAILLHSAVGYGAPLDHKVIAPKGAIDRLEGVQLWHDYGAFALYEVPDTTLRSMSPSLKSRVRVADEMDRLEISAYPFDTQRSRLSLPTDLTVTEATGGMLHLVQFVGPIKQIWLDQVEATGALPVHYIANNGYLLWTDDTAREALDSLALQGDFLQYSAPFHPAFKIGPALKARLDGKESATVR